MTIKELRDIVNKIPKKYDDLVVWKSKDDEGNGFNLFGGIDTDGLLLDTGDKYYQESIGSIHYSKDDNCLEDLNDEEYRQYKKNNRCAVVH